MSGLDAASIDESGSDRLPLSSDRRNQRPRLLFASYSAKILGPTKSLLLLLRHLRDEYDVRVMVAGDGPLLKALQSDGICAHSVRRMDIATIPEIVGVLRAWRPDLVYLNNTNGAMRNVAIASISMRIPYVCHVREMGAGKSWKRMWYLWAATSVVAVSRACGMSVERFVRPGRLHVVHNGIEVAPKLDGTALSRNDLRLRLGISKTATVILSVAHVAPRKGQEFAIHAMAAIALDHPDVQLYVIGKLEDDRPYYESVLRLVESKGLAGRVHFLGYRLDVADFYACADIFLHTAVVDPHPRVVLEAMSAGLPIVAFGADGVQETISDGETGYLVAPRDINGLAARVQELLADRSIRLRMGSAARERVVRDFNARMAAEKVMEIVRGILDPRPESSVRNRVQDR